MYRSVHKQAKVWPERKFWVDAVRRPDILRCFAVDRHGEPISEDAVVQHTNNMKKKLVSWEYKALTYVILIISAFGSYVHYLWQENIYWLVFHCLHKRYRKGLSVFMRVQTLQVLHADNQHVLGIMRASQGCLPKGWISLGRLQTASRVGLLHLRLRALMICKPRKAAELFSTKCYAVISLSKHSQTLRNTSPPIQKSSNAPSSASSISRISQSDSSPRK